jgi:hypothetical protein
LYWSPLKLRLLPPALRVSDTSTPGSLVLQLSDTEYGLPAAKILKPLLPLRLNFTGTPLPAFTAFQHLMSAVDFAARNAVAAFPIAA